MDKSEPDIKSEDGVRYYGETKNVLGRDGEMVKVSHGYGVIKWPDGTCYEGNWSNGLKNGHGK